MKLKDSENWKSIGILQRCSYPSELFCYGVYIGSRDEDD